VTETPPAEHPRQLAARLKLAQAQLELAEGRRQLELTRGGLRRAPLHKRPVVLLAIAFQLISLKLLEGAARSYARTAESPPKSSILFERARQERAAALESATRSEAHRQEAGAALRAPVRRRPWTASVVQFVFGWAIVGTALAVNYVVFAAFDSNYFRWYLDNGALISLVFGFVSLAVRLDDYPDLVSSNPMLYLLACLTLSLHLGLAWNQVVAVDPERSPGLLLAKVFDTIVSLLAFLAVTVAFVGWLLVVAPIQHLTYAVLGAPARNALRNPVGSRFDPAADDTTVAAEAGDTAGHVIGYVEKPVALTSALAAAVLWIISQFVG
jgi:hypothetical protein